jgi:hypothetical protein
MVLSPQHSTPPSSSFVGRDCISSFLKTYNEDVEALPFGDIK